MGFLRRLLGGESDADRKAAAADDLSSSQQGIATADVEERARDLELLREDQERLDDLARRQLRYAEYAWKPPAQGGERRADDEDAGSQRGDAS